MQRNSGFIVKQVNGELALKEITLVSYQTVFQKLIRSFSHIQFEHVHQAYNKHEDALSTLVYKIGIPGAAIDVGIISKTL